MKRIFVLLFALLLIAGSLFGCVTRKTDIQNINKSSFSAPNAAVMNRSISHVKKNSGKWTIGAAVSFGSFEQDNNVMNGTEPIQWIILDYDEYSMLLISKYCLDAQPYNNGWSNVTWDSSSIRKWLNEDFYQYAFTSEQKQAIMVSYVSADNNPYYSTYSGKDCLDNVFLLSISEANYYLNSDYSRQAPLTNYYEARQGFHAEANWWLRSPGDSPDKVALVWEDGSIDAQGEYADNLRIAVRPAIRLDLSKVRIS